jgi:SSS family solute:Na+ symporter
MTFIPLLFIFIFFALMIYMNRNNLGVSTFGEYATANRSISFVGITLSILATWYVGAMFTAWAGFAVNFGFIALYVTIYAVITMIVMYYVGPRTFIIGVKYGIETQSELLGFRYRSKSIRMLSGLWGIAFTIPWLIIELVTQGYVFNYATNGLINQFWGMVLGISVVAIYASLGGMRSVITANIFQGIIMLVGGTGLMIYFMYNYFGGFSSGVEMVSTQFPEMLTFPGPGWEPATPYWTSIVLLGGLGGFMWPWAYNKLFAADSIRTIKMTGLLAPILGAIFWSVFVFTGIFLHSLSGATADVQGAFLWIAKESGPIALGFLGVIIMANSVGTVSGIIQAVSTAISRDLVQVIKHNITDEKAISIARYSVVAVSILSILFGSADLGLLIFLALFSYNGIIMLFPTVTLGLYWKRANKEGAIIGLLAGTILSMALSLINPGFINGLGWQPGVYGLLLNFTIMIVAGYMKKPDIYVDQLWDDFNLIRSKTETISNQSVVASSLEVK